MSVEGGRGGIEIAERENNGYRASDRENNRGRKRVIEKERIKLKLNYLGQRERKRESVCD